MKQIRSSKYSKFIAKFLALIIFLQIGLPIGLSAQTSGPSQPEFNSFTPISTSDMVDLASGDYNYNIPIMDVGGYPINLAYNSGVTMDQEASWVGLGWNLNVGQINRQVRGLPDDFNGDLMTYQNQLRPNWTLGTTFNVSPAVFGVDFPFSFGLGVQYNNYEGVTFRPSLGVSYSLSDNTKVGFNFSSSTADGASVSPSVSVSEKKTITESSFETLESSFGASISSRRGFENLTMSSSSKTTSKVCNMTTGEEIEVSSSNGSGGATINLNTTHNYTPTKRVAFDNNNRTFNATLGFEVTGGEAQVRISGYGSYQKINSEYEYRSIGAYGYENTHLKGNKEGVLDFNREKEQIVSKHTTSLPVTNYTYDVYSIQGQGISGMFRPHRSQVGYVYNDVVSDFSSSGQFGVEIGLGNLVHVGGNFNVSPTESSTGPWINGNNAINVFAHKPSTTLLQEKVTFKMAGELDVDQEGLDIYKDRIQKSKALRLQLGGSFLSRSLNATYAYKNFTDNSVSMQNQSVNAPILRQHRLLRNTTIEKITKDNADGKFIFSNSHGKSHHTAGIKILKPDGTQYVFGKSLYNVKKVEATFDCSGSGSANDNGLIRYSSITGSNRNTSDKYVSKITTPAYAHTFLISSIISTDYEDIDNNGPSPNDLGSYTKFNYTTPYNYKWRTPIGNVDGSTVKTASFNEGLKASDKDQKAHFIYGEKELSYLYKIETKTHVAFFDLDSRQDALEVEGEDGGLGTNRMKYIERIRLYSLSDLSNGLDPGFNSNIKPIKTVHFEYDYSLCKNTPNFSGVDVGRGKLTLRKVYFTYKNSNMGKYTPYKFEYSNNPDYKINEIDIWGNYKPNVNGLLNVDYPFVEQSDREIIDAYAGSWALKSVELPSGGTITITTESDDYQYVQNRKAMQMYKVVGAGVGNNPSEESQNLYTMLSQSKYIYVRVPESETINAGQFVDKYLKENKNKPIYFKFLLNMTDNKYEYVSGYFKIDASKLNQIVVSNGLASIPLEFLRREGGLAGGQYVNPISKSGWGFARRYLNRMVYSMGGSETNDDFVSIVQESLSSIAGVMEIFAGPNGVLQRKGCAKKFIKDKSWVRLENSTGTKLGGGLRVKKIELSDSWHVMNSVNNNDMIPIYEELYGQEFYYSVNGKSSGVATFEANANPENPFVEPFYGNDGNYADRISSPKDLNYIELPFGEGFFPSPTITYSNVSVKSLSKKNDNPGRQIKKHATGRVETIHYTSKDFPTKVDYTPIDIKFDNIDPPIFDFLDILSFNQTAATQGFSIETNDMNGKIRFQQVYAEDQDKPISYVEYRYNTVGDTLNNEFVTIDPEGRIQKKVIGLTYDVINDFNQSKSVTQTIGADGNLAAFLVGIFPAFVPMVLPRFAYHSSELRTSTTTKVTHRSGILVEKIAYDLGAVVSTRNLAWDAYTGQILLTETVNEYNDKYYSFNYPAHWYYKALGMASHNIGVKGALLSSGGSFSVLGYNGDIRSLLKIGDVLSINNSRYWVVEYVGTTKVKLMNESGQMVNNIPFDNFFRVVKSGNKNLQMNSMASVTSMTNPLVIDDDFDIDELGNLKEYLENPFDYESYTGKIKVVNASAIEYSDNWLSQCENYLPNTKGLINGLGNPVNPYLYNTRGEWRPIRSFAYLTGRNNQDNNPRKSGYFNDFSSFYNLQDSNWTINPNVVEDKWTFASEITMYSPQGVELENKDALDRYSSAQYGYNYTLPQAVASNAQYREIGFDGFEDYTNHNIPAILKPHFGYQTALNENVTVTNQRSHTGTASLKIKSGQSAALERKLGGCKDSLIVVPAEPKMSKIKSKK